MLANDVTDRINAETEARRSKQMLESLIDNIPQRIFWKDLDLRYLGCNSAFARDAFEGLRTIEKIMELKVAGIDDPSFLQPDRPMSAIGG